MLSFSLIEYYFFTTYYINTLQTVGVFRVLANYLTIEVINLIIGLDNRNLDGWATNLCHNDISLIEIDIKHVELFCAASCSWI